MFNLGSWESFAGFSSVGGLIGYVIHCERNKETTRSLPAQCHALHASRNIVVSGFLGFLIFLTALKVHITTDPTWYLACGVVGMLSCDAAIILIDFAKGASVDALRAVYNRLRGGA